MHSRSVSTLAVIGVALAGSIVFATTAAASVRFDPATQTGFIDRGDVQTAFGWSDAILQARASGIAVSHSRSIDDIYSVVCGWDTTSTGDRDHSTTVVTHNRESRRENLGVTVAYDSSSETRTNPTGKIIGFRLTGAVSGFSGTSVEPMVGGPCPEEEGQVVVKTIDAVRLVSSTTTSTLTASFEDVFHNLIVTRNGAGYGASLRGR